MKKQIFLLAFLSFGLFTACDTDDDSPNESPQINEELLGIWYIDALIVEGEETPYKIAVRIMLNSTKTELTDRLIYGVVKKTLMRKEHTPRLITPLHLPFLETMWLLWILLP